MQNFQILFQNKNKEKKINYILKFKYLEKTYIYYTPYFDTELTNEELNTLFVENIDNCVYDYILNDSILLQDYSNIIDIFNLLNIVEIEIPDLPILCDSYGNIIDHYIELGE